MFRLRFLSAVLMALAFDDTTAVTQDFPVPFSEYYGTVERVIDGDNRVVRLDL